MQSEMQRYDDAYWDWAIHAAKRVREYLEFAADYMPCIRDAIRQAQKAEERSAQKDKIAELEEKIGKIPLQLKQSINCLEELSQSLRQLQGSMPCSEDKAWEPGDEMEMPRAWYWICSERTNRKGWLHERSLFCDCNAGRGHWAACCVVQRERCGNAECRHAAGG